MFISAIEYEPIKKEPHINAIYLERATYKLYKPYSINTFELQASNDFADWDLLLKGGSLYPMVSLAIFSLLSLWLLAILHFTKKLVILAC